MEYVVATSYRKWDRVGEPYEKGGKLYTKIKCECPRCGGLGIIASRIENDRIVPIPVDGGICYQCGGSKYITKEARLYTSKEYETIERNQKKAKERKAEELKAKMEAEYAHKKAVWHSPYHNRWHSRDVVRYKSVHNVQAYPSLHPGCGIRQV